MGGPRERPRTVPAEDTRPHTHGPRVLARAWAWVAAGQRAPGAGHSPATPSGKDAAIPSLLARVEARTVAVCRVPRDEAPRFACTPHGWPARRSLVLVTDRPAPPHPRPSRKRTAEREKHLKITPTVLCQNVRG